MDDDVVTTDLKSGFLGVYLVLGIFTAVPLAVAALLLNVLYLGPNSKIAAAQSWQQVPCEILDVKLTGYETANLDLRYKYEFDGQSYESTQYDLLTGESGEDGWARDAFVRLSKNRSTICFVNPADPTQAVLDRERRHPTIALVLPAVFGTVGLGFGSVLLIGFVQTIVSNLRSSGESEFSSASTDLEIRGATVPAHTGETIAAHNHGEPDDVPTGARPPRIAAAIGFLAAFGLVAVFFLLFEGVDFAKSLSYGEVTWTPVDGTVAWKRDSGISTLYGDVTEYSIHYQFDGKEFASRCYSMTTPESMELELDSQRPWRGRIIGTTTYATPRIFLAFPIGFGALLSFGLAAMIWRSIFGWPNQQQPQHHGLPRN